MSSAPAVKVKEEPGTAASDLGGRILSICSAFPSGISDKQLALSLPDVNNKDRAEAVNSLLAQSKIDLFTSAEKGLLYRCKASASQAGAIRGDAEEKLVYQLIEAAGNKGTWIRDIRVKSNLGQTQLNRVLKSLKSRKLIKDVKAVNSNRKIVYMLYNLEPDRSVTGGAWYSDQDFESEFVDVLNTQCYRFLQQKLERSRQKQSALGGPIAARNASLASSKEVRDFITELKISRVDLKIEDIEAILDTLIYDNKVEKVVSSGASGAEVSKLYRAKETLLPSAGLMRVPCGGCPVINQCSAKGTVNPIKCIYLTEWLS